MASSFVSPIYRRLSGFLQFCMDKERESTDEGGSELTGEGRGNAGMGVFIVSVSSASKPTRPIKY